uniref:Uncharacterized protein n=1 Tax=Bionectria ochroleuca TaxID=29856 RepID=A0A8H7TLG5_BIOOC
MAYNQPYDPDALPRFAEPEKRGPAAGKSSSPAPDQRYNKPAPLPQQYQQHHQPPPPQQHQQPPPHRQGTSSSYSQQPSSHPHQQPSPHPHQHPVHSPPLGSLHTTATAALPVRPYKPQMTIPARVYYPSSGL